LVYKDAETGEDVYAFFHLTFQEYFAACAINDWRKDFLNHVPENPMQGIYRIFEPHWKEVILLWLGRDEEELREQKEEFIKMLVGFEDGCVDFYNYRAYFLAAVGISEFKNCSLADAIVEQIIKWSFGCFNIEEQRWRTFMEPIEEKARITLSETDCSRAIKGLLDLLSTIEDESIHWRIAEILVKLGTGKHQVIYELVQRLAITENIDPENPQEIDELVQLLANTKYWYTRIRDAYSLGEIDPGKLPKIDDLVQLLATNEPDYISRGAANDLKNIRQNNQMPSVVSALQYCLDLEVYKTNFNRFNNCYKVLWHCAQNMTYPDFYQAWHQTTIHERE
jgi:hypothetical protein